MSFDGRFLHNQLDKRISQVEENLNKLKQWRDILEDFEFHKCKIHEIVYGTHKGSADNVCKLCKREYEK